MKQIENIVISYPISPSLRKAFLFHTAYPVTVSGHLQEIRRRTCQQDKSTYYSSNSDGSSDKESGNIWHDIELYLLMTYQHP